MTLDHDSEWEYEYGEDETEDFYITLDLTTHVPPSFTNNEKKSRVTKTSRGSNKSLANAPGTGNGTGTALRPPAPASPGVHGEDPASSPPPPQPPQPPQSQQPAQPSALPAPSHPLSSDRIQIVDLHGDNPLVSYNNALYSCQWATDVGTSLYLTPPLHDIDPAHPPLRSTASFDLLGTGSARLIAIPATIKPRRSAPLSAAAPRPAYPDHESFTTAEGDIIRHTESHGFTIELPSTASATRVNQARFLGRLSAIKAQRGDRDAVPITNIKIYRHPEGWEAERDEWIAKETALSGRDRLEAELRMKNTPGRGTRFSNLPIEGQQSQLRIEDSVEPDTPTEAGADDQSDPDLDAPDPDRIVLASQIPRKRKTRGGPRGGAPSGKRLRQSLGLPEARRDRRPAGQAPGRPRQIRLDSEALDDDEGAMEDRAGSQQGSEEPAMSATASASANVNQDADEPAVNEVGEGAGRPNQ